MKKITIDSVGTLKKDWLLDNWFDLAVHVYVQRTTYGPKRMYRVALNFELKENLFYVNVTEHVGIDDDRLADLKAINSYFRREHKKLVLQRLSIENMACHFSGLGAQAEAA